MSTLETLAEFLPPYLAEVEELLASARSWLLAAEAATRKGSTHPRGVRDLFRALHTVKGLSAMVEVEPVVSLSHWMESSLRRADQEGGRLSLGAIERLFQGLDAIEQRVRALGAGKPVEAAPAALLESLEHLASDPSAAVVAPEESLVIELEPALLSKLSASERRQLVQGVQDGRRAVLASFSPSPARAQAGLNISAMRERLATCGELVKVIPVSVPANPLQPGGLYFGLLLLTSEGDAALLAASGLEPQELRTLAGSAAPDAPGPELPRADVAEDGGTSLHGVVRVDSNRLDVAMEHVAALVVGRSRLERAVARLSQAGANTRELAQLLGENGRLLRDLRASVLRLRMVRVGEVLDRLPLMVRGLRRSTGKQVKLELELGNAELDKAVGDRLFPAIVHLVRNAVDHAIEAPEERMRLGKLPEGTLRISCHERSSAQLELVLQDDGRGVDAEAVARRAGAEVPADAAALLALLCRPGLSTKAEVTTTSGRGMGMDIVKRIAVEQLGGDLRMETALGVGTTFTLRVPLTISIVEAFVFESGDRRYATAVSGVEELMDIDPARVVHGPAPKGRPGAAGLRMMERRGVAVPLLGLHGLLHGHESPSERKAIVIQHQGRPMAFGVDRLLHQQEIVIRPLEDPLVRVRGVSGATDLGDGVPTLVLDLAAFSAAYGAQAAP